MGNDSTVVLSDEPLFRSHLTDEEIAEVADMTVKTVRHYRWVNRLAQGERLLVERTSYSGRLVRIKKIFTSVDDVRAWLEVDGRNDALAALDKLMASKLAERGE